jgi:transcription-repair coupling factor (superfamily II helicase)
MTGDLGDLVRRLAAARPAGGARAHVSGLRGAAGPLTVAALSRTTGRPVVVITPDAAAADAFAADLRFILGEERGPSPLARRIHALPPWDVPPFEPLSPSRDVLAARAEGLHHLGQTPRLVVVTSVEAWAQRCLPAATLREATTYLVVGDDRPPDTLAAHAVDWGYHRVPLVQDPGDLAVRGGILDVWPVGHERPVRLEFFGDEIESLREFDAESQRSLQPVEELLLLPVTEVPRSRLGPASARRVDERAADIGVARRERRDLVEAVRERLMLPGFEQLLPLLYERLATVAEHCPNDAMFWLHGNADVVAEIQRTWERVREHAEAAEAGGVFHPPPDALYLSPAEWRATLAGRHVVEVDALEQLASGAIAVTTHGTDAAALRPSAGAPEPMAPVARRLAEFATAGRLVIVAGTESRRERVRHVLADHGLEVASSAARFPDLPAAEGRPTPLALLGELGAGTWWPAEGLALVTDVEILGEPRPQRRRRRARVDDWLASLAQLSPDDYVVHLDHGIGVYRGLRHMQVADTEGDYLHLEYAGGDRLYVPVDCINVVQRHVGADGAAPALDKLGGTSWARTKEKARESLLAMAHELLDVAAAREAHGRTPYVTRDALYDDFVARFPFEETADQQRAIEQVLEDLQGPRPMDRLVCGDVGFGKTEVALRAAFLTVLAGRQVAVLVPTTLLAQQHFETFRARFDGHPVVVEVVSRFRAPAQNKETLARVASGRVDVVIGTHRLLQRDVGFRDLGLLVIDEEHRFGVRDKERVRAMRSTVDVLTLTATPIPRTLNLSLSGLRELSVIATPPVDRLAIRTYVTRFDDRVIRDAVLREFGRAGQVFFVHNRVETIDRMAEQLAEIVPEARIEVTHGQLAERTLEQRMLRFMRGEANLLVTSAIIESGIDIPTANTLIVNRADGFGLAQLYQLRGRVGRSHQRAYAYLLIPGEHLITSDAQKRLRVLQELDDLGGGFRLAAHDLEIRGAGNLLGKEQSGNITAVGLELYTQMLEDAVRAARGDPAEREVEPEIQLGIPAYVPDTYVRDVNQRLDVYKRLAGASGEVALREIAEELVDRYGPLPPLVDTLLRLMEFRRLLKDLHVLSARRRGPAVVFEFDERTPLDVEQVLDVVRGRASRLRLTSGTTLEVCPEADDHDGVIRELGAALRSLKCT